MTPSITITIPLEGNEDILASISALLKDSSKALKAVPGKSPRKSRTAKKMELVEKPAKPEVITLEDLNTLAATTAKSKGRASVLALLAPYSKRESLQDVPVEEYAQFKEELELLLVSQ